MAASIPPPGLDLSADQGGRIVASMAALIILPTLAVLARLTSRQLAHAGFWVRSPAGDEARCVNIDLAVR